MRVTFDSNVWEDVVCPERCAANRKCHEQALLVRKSLEAGQVTGFFCEAWTTLEAVMKKDRPDFLAKQAIELRLVETIQSDGTTDMAVFMGPNQSCRPPLPPKFEVRLSEAIALGMRLLMVPRLSELDLPTDFYAPQTERIARQTAKVLHAIEERGVGRAQIRAFGLELARRHACSGCFSDIPDVPFCDDDRKKIVLLVAEWADGEAVAAHVGYGNDLFCSEDCNCTHSGTPSVLDPKNRQWLREEFRVQFVDLGKLAEMLTT